MFVTAQIGLVVANGFEVDFLVDVHFGASVHILDAVETLAGRLAVNDQLFSLQRVLDVVAQPLHVAVDIHEQVDDPRNRHQVQKAEEYLYACFLGFKLKPKA